MIEYCGELLLPMKEYLVSMVLAVYTIGNMEWEAGGGDLLGRYFIL